jgi:PAS domain S-box-containing protein
LSARERFSLSRRGACFIELETKVQPVPSSSIAQAAVADRERHFDLSIDLLCIAGLDGYFRRVNASWTRVLGWSQSELLAQPVESFMHPDDRAQTLRARAGLAQGAPVRGLENRYRCKDGSYRWLSWQSTIEPGGSTVFAVARDITEQRRIEQELLVTGKPESTTIFSPASCSILR